MAPQATYLDYLGIEILWAARGPLGNHFGSLGSLSGFLLKFSKTSGHILTQSGRKYPLPGRKFAQTAANTKTISNQILHFTPKPAGLTSISLIRPSILWSSHSFQQAARHLPEFGAKGFQGLESAAERTCAHLQIICSSLPILMSCSRKGLKPVRAG